MITDEELKEAMIENLGKYIKEIQPYIVITKKPFKACLRTDATEDIKRKYRILGEVGKMMGGR